MISAFSIPKTTAETDERFSDGGGVVIGSCSVGWESQNLKISQSSGFPQLWERRFPTLESLEVRF